MTDTLSISSNSALRWILQKLSDGRSTYHIDRFVGQQAIVWAIADHDLYHHMATLGYNKLSRVN